LAAAVVAAEHLVEQELPVVLVAVLDEMQALQVLAEQEQQDKVLLEDQHLVVVMHQLQAVAVPGQ
jgi:hypothetical protein